MLKHQLITTMYSTKVFLLIHWGRGTHICVCKLTTVDSDNGLSPGRRQAIIWTNARILLIGPLVTNFSDSLIGIQTFSLKKCFWNGVYLSRPQWVKSLLRLVSNLVTSELSKDTPYLTLMGELWGVYHEHFGERFWKNISMVSCQKGPISHA